jgi:hypothetical protein
MSISISIYMCRPHRENPNASLRCCSFRYINMPATNLNDPIVDVRSPTTCIPEGRCERDPSPPMPLIPLLRQCVWKEIQYETDTERSSKLRKGRHSEADT